MANPRVSARNIQFRDTIQVREIPRENSIPLIDTSQFSNQSLWNPNLSQTDAFPAASNKQRNIIIGVVVGGLVVVLVIIGIVLAVVLTQKTTTTPDNSLTYNQACTIGSNQCMSSQGLSCPNGFCSCSSPNSWNSGSSVCTLLSSNQACTSSNQCFTSSGLSYTNNLCQCDPYHQWDSANNICQLIQNSTLSFGATCVNGTSQCNSTVDLTCAGSCICQNAKIWNISNCVCPPGTFLNSSNLCQAALILNQTCLMGSNQCDSTLNLFCNNSRCQCDFSTRFWSINLRTCLPRLNYTDMCVHDSDCRPTLICPQVPGVCNCSRFLPDLVCNCDNTKYFDPLITQCVSRSSLGGTCSVSANYTCLISLYCNAGTCACPTGTSWIAGNTTCVPTG